MPPLERAWKAVGGRTPLSNLGVPSLVLHTTGAKSGLARDTELMYCPDGDEILITGSNFAREMHPAWTANLLKNPDAAVTVHRKRIPVHASLVPANWPGYRGYERTAGRELRIFRLVPTTP
jgi:deazaflavin-dependent oxidoreductase (nitroreductase family)